VYRPVLAASGSWCLKLGFGCCSNIVSGVACQMDLLAKFPHAPARSRALTQARRIKIDQLMSIIRGEQENGKPGSMDRVHLRRVLQGS